MIATSQPPYWSEVRPRPRSRRPLCPLLSAGFPHPVPWSLPSVCWVLFIYNIRGGVGGEQYKSWVRLPPIWHWGRALGAALLSSTSTSTSVPRCPIAVAYADAAIVGRQSAVDLITVYLGTTHPSSTGISTQTNATAEWLDSARNQRSWYYASTGQQFGHRGLPRNAIPNTASRGRGVLLADQNTLHSVSCWSVRRRRPFIMEIIAPAQYQGTAEFAGFLLLTGASRLRAHCTPFCLNPLADEISNWQPTEC